MEYSLEDAIKLTKECCDKRELLLYHISVGTQIGDDPTHRLVCAGCRTDHFWEENNSRVVVCNSKVTDKKLYDTIKHSLTWKDALTKAPKYVDYFCKKLGLDKKKLERTLNKP